MIKTKYIYILSQRYSGSTLLSFLLGTHPEIATIGERRKFYVKSLKPSPNDMQRCSCGELFQECDFWDTIKKGFLSRVNKADLKTNFTEFEIFRNKYINRLVYELYKVSTYNKFSRHILPFRSKIRKANELNEILLDEILKVSQKSVFLDSSKSINQILFLSQIPTIDLKVVWLTRDPRAQVNSALKYNKWTIKQAAENWKKEMKQNNDMLTKLKISYSRLSYESLCKNPKKEVSNILDFVGIDSSPISLEFRNQTQHIMGNFSMRLGTDDKIVERQEWRESLSQMEIKYIEDVTIDYSQFHSDI